MRLSKFLKDYKCYHNKKIDCKNVKKEYEKREREFYAYLKNFVDDLDDANCSHDGSRFYFNTNEDVLIFLKGILHNYERILYNKKN